MSRIRLLAALLVVSAPVSLSATTLIKVSLEEMSYRADAVIIGRCVGQESAWIDGSLMTLVKMDVEEVLKGSPGARVTVALPGGADHTRKVPVAQVWPNAPRIGIGEKKVLFLEKFPAHAAFSIVGYSQGLFSLYGSPGKGPMASQNLSGITLVESGGGRETGRPNVLPLATLKEQVYRAAAIAEKGRLSGKK